MSGPATTFQKRVEAAVALIGRGDLVGAHAALSALLREVPKHPDLLQLAGVVHRRAGRLEEAIEHFRASLARIETQAHVHNNLGGALVATGNRADAEGHFRRALALKPDYVDARYNLALLLLESRPAEAQTLLEAVTRSNPTYANAFDALGLALAKLGDLPGAFAAASRAVALGPTAHTAHHNLGQAAMALRDFAAAERAYEAALRVRPASDASWIGLGNALRSQERNEDAARAFEQAVAANPSNTDAHRLLNEMLWQTGRTERYLGSYPVALATKPSDSALRVSYANELLRICQPNEALAELSIAAQAAPQDAHVNDALARAYAMSGDFGRALVHHNKAMERAPEVAQLTQNCLETLLKAEQHGDALDASGAALQRFPFDQGILAMHTTALQILDDPRHGRLADFATNAKVFDIKPPEGFTDEAAFNKALADTLRTLHATKNHPTDQTLRGGTQTFGALFDRTDPLIQMLKAQIEKAVARYIAEMPDDKAHPLFARKSKGFEFSGSWSVCLHEGGFHTNHIHPKGWISSAYYVQIPPETNAANAPSNPGWFKMGETNLQLGRHEKVHRLVQPAAGRLVLFPSYFWHGTVPFQSDSERLTVAFDVVPA